MGLRLGLSELKRKAVSIAEVGDLYHVVGCYRDVDSGLLSYSLLIVRR